MHQHTLLPMGGTRLGKAGHHAVFIGDVDLAEDAADFGRERFALFLVHVEDRDLGALGGQRAGGRRAEARCAAGDNGGGIG